MVVTLHVLCVKKIFLLQSGYSVVTKFLEDTFVVVTTIFFFNQKNCLMADVIRALSTASNAGGAANNIPGASHPAGAPPGSANGGGEAPVEGLLI